MSTSRGLKLAFIADRETSTRLRAMVRQGRHDVLCLNLGTSSCTVAVDTTHGTRILDNWGDGASITEVAVLTRLEYRPSSDATEPDDVCIGRSVEYRTDDVVRMFKLFFDDSNHTRKHRDKLAAQARELKKESAVQFTIDFLTVMKEKIEKKTSLDYTSMRLVASVPATYSLYSNLMYTNALRQVWPLTPDTDVQLLSEPVATLVGLEELVISGMKVCAMLVCPQHALMSCAGSGLDVCHCSRLGCWRWHNGARNGVADVRHILIAC